MVSPNESPRKWHCLSVSKSTSNVQTQHSPHQQVFNKKVCWMFVQSKNTAANDWLQPFARHWGKWSSRPLICWSLSRAQMTRLLADFMFWHGAQQDDAVKTRGSLGFRLVVWHHVRSLKSPGEVIGGPVEVYVFIEIWMHEEFPKILNKYHLLFLLHTTSQHQLKKVTWIPS